MENYFDLIVLGAGSGGLAAAKRAAKYGARVAIVEGNRVGGTCVIRGCVPKKLLAYGSLYGEYIKSANSFGVNFKDPKVDSGILLKNVRKEVDRLNNLHVDFLSKAGVELIRGWAEFSGPRSVKVRDSSGDPIGRELFSRYILIAVGGKASRPSIQGSSLGWVSDDMFELEKFPKKIVIVGAGFIACEFSSILNGLGSEVTQLIRGSQLLRGFDSDLSDTLKNAMELKGINFEFGQSLLCIEEERSGLKIITQSSKSIHCDGILFAIGRKPALEGLQLGKAGINCARNKIVVDINNETNIPNVFAIGDVSNQSNLTPVAIEEGRVFSDSVFGNKKRLVDYELVPKAVFSQPEIATVGLDEDEAIKKFGKDGIKVFSSRFRPMSKSLSGSEERCLLKLIVKIETGIIIGCHMVGENASEIIQMATIALKMGATKDDFDKTMALHPTIAEEFVTMI